MKAIEFIKGHDKIINNGQSREKQDEALAELFEKFVDERIEEKLNSLRSARKRGGKKAKAAA